jgi:hypothetical protein
MYTIKKTFPTALAALLAIAITSCSKVPLTNPPIPLPNILSLEVFPFQDYLDSLNALATDSINTQTIATYLYDPLIAHAEVPGQEELAYAFRTSVPGAVTSLGILEPATGYTHTVTLWDSATGEVLAQAYVPSLDSGRWTYVSLALTGQEVPIAANHGYIVGFDSRSQGGPIGTATPGNNIYIIMGIFDNRSNPAGFGYSNIDPFTSKTFSFEGEYMTFYNNSTPLVGPPFPGGLNNLNGDPYNNLFGICDIGFIPEPQ